MLGAGQARTRTRRAVQRDVPFALLVHTLVVIWYARHGYDRSDIAGRRQAEPWYPGKDEPAFEDMPTKLRRVLICARISAGSAAQPEPGANHSRPGSLDSSRRITAKHQKVLKPRFHVIDTARAVPAYLHKDG